MLWKSGRGVYWQRSQAPRAQRCSVLRVTAIPLSLEAGSWRLARGGNPLLVGTGWGPKGALFQGTCCRRRGLSVGPGRECPGNLAPTAEVLWALQAPSSGLFWPAAFAFGSQQSAVDAPAVLGCIHRSSLPADTGRTCTCRRPELPGTCTGSTGPMGSSSLCIVTAPVFVGSDRSYR
jgi:hypothetical protein